jgi:hypothetical protein
LWEWVTGNPPFDQIEPIFAVESPEVSKQLRRELKGSKPPWIGVATQADSPLFRQVEALVRSCCNRNPLLRPSAAFVAQSLFMILVQHPQVAELEQQSTDELKSRVKSALDLAQKKIKDKSGEDEGSPTVSREDEEVLRCIAYHGDRRPKRAIEGERQTKMLKDEVRYQALTTLT